jgi:hypothetical protein
MQSVNSWLLNIAKHDIARSIANASLPHRLALIATDTPWCCQTTTIMCAALPHRLALIANDID